MTILYSPRELGFYDTAVHKSAQIPDDAIAVSAQQRNELLVGASSGLRIQIGESGALELVAPPVDPADLAARARAWRDGEIDAIKWLRERHRDEQDMSLPLTLADERFAELMGYLQTLRDWPQSEQFPAMEHRPVAPAWIATQTQ